MSKQRLVHHLADLNYRVSHAERYVHVKIQGVWLTFGPVPKDWDLSYTNGRLILELDSIGESDAHP